MEISQFKELSGLTEDPFTSFNSNYLFNSSSFDGSTIINTVEPSIAFGDHNHNHNHHHLYSNDIIFDHNYKPIITEQQPSKQLKTTSNVWNSSPSVTMTNRNPYYAETDSYRTTSTSAHDHVKIRSNSSSTTPQDHILAERKRRQKLSQRFIALSALIPGLKKMDKASVLGDAIKYLKNLQEKVKTLEEQTNKKSNIESVVFVKRYEVSLSDEIGEISSSSDVKLSVNEQLLPEIEARFSGKDVLIRVHCEKKTGVVQETLAQIQKLNLSVINTTALTFATFALDITVVAQMDQGFTMTMKDVVKNLRTALKRFM